MKKIGKRHFFAVIALIGLLMTVSMVIVKAAAVNEVTLKVGEQRGFAVGATTYNDIQGASWTSSNPSVARVASYLGKNATVQGVGGGTCTITARITTYCMVYDITLKKYVIQDIVTDVASWTVNVTPDPTSISLNQTSITMLTTDRSLQLRATVMPSGADQTVTYSSSNTNVVSVNANGYLTPYQPGNAVITASTVNGLTATCNITVNRLEIESLQLDKDKLELARTTTGKLSYTVLPVGADGTITWSSSNPAIATVDSTGTVTAKKIGETDIIAESSNGHQAVCKVTVYQPNLESIKINEESLTMVQGDKTTLLCSLSPAGAVGKVQWKSSRPDVATVNGKGIIKAKKGGTATITAYTASGLEAKCDVTVRSRAIDILMETDEITLSFGEDQKLAYTLYPEDSVGTVTWSSDDPDIVSVDSEGNVTAKKSGTAHVTASLSPNVNETWTITVPIVPVEDVELSAESKFVSAGESMKIETVFTPSYASGQVEWISSDSSIAKVDANGTVTALKGGNAEITATVNGVSAFYEIQVIDGAWADISMGSIAIFEGRCTIQDSSYDGLYYTQYAQPNQNYPLDGPLTIVQSTPVTGNNVSTYCNAYIILAGVHIESSTSAMSCSKVSGEETPAIVLELKEGTENYLESLGTKWAGLEVTSNLNICGTGSLTVRSQYAAAIGGFSIDMGNLTISSGNLDIHTNYSNTAVIGTNGGEPITGKINSYWGGKCGNITILPEANIIAGGGCRAVGAYSESGEYNGNYDIAEGSITWTP